MCASGTGTNPAEALSGNTATPVEASMTALTKNPQISTAIATTHRRSRAASFSLSMSVASMMNIAEANPPSPRYVCIDGIHVWIAIGMATAAASSATRSLVRPSDSHATAIAMNKTRPHRRCSGDQCVQ